LGVDNILTSGSKEKAAQEIEWLQELKQLVK
jgi:copper homeostasis protein CutC